MKKHWLVNGSCAGKAQKHRRNDLSEIHRRNLYNLTLGTLREALQSNWEPLLGNFYLGTFSWESSLGNLYLGIFTWEPLLGNLDFGTKGEWALELLRSAPKPFTMAEDPKASAVGEKSPVSHLTCTPHTTTQSGPASQRSAAGAANNLRTSMSEILSLWVHQLARAINRLIMVILPLPTQKLSAICKAKLNCICICIRTARHVPGGRRVRLLAHKSSCQHHGGRICWWRHSFLITAP